MPGKATLWRWPSTLKSKGQTLPVWAEKKFTARWPASSARLRGVPCLLDGDTLVWDSLAICEYLAEKAPTLWPTDGRQRAEARAISAEMHAGFGALRQSMPMDIHASKPHDGRGPEVLADIARIVTIWEGCRARFAAAGPFLFGAFSIADAMYAPVAWRFKTYAVDVPPASRAWIDALCALPAMQEWQAGALAEQVAK